MTKDKILNMPAGREMDALIAEKVMGGGFASATEWYFTPPFGHPVLKFVQHYSTDIAAAWEVVEKLMPLFRFALAQVDSGHLWFAQFENIEHFGEWEAFENESETAPLAICRAALFTVVSKEQVKHS